MTLNGKTAIVTGGYSGLGLETVRALSAAGATVIVPARSPDKAWKALSGIARVEQAELDLLDPKSIAGFASQFLAGGHSLHMLINSAGIMATPLTRDKRGYESQLAANHLGHFQLTAQLWPALIQAAGARVVSVSSRGHHFSDFNFEDPNFEHRAYDKWTSYGQSKTANILFALALDERGKKSGVRSYSLHPGRIMSTDLVRHLSKEDLQQMGMLDELGNPTPAAAGKTPAQGAATSVWCATNDQLQEVGGVYCEDVDVAILAEDADHGKRGVKPYAVDRVSADRLWALSESLIGSKFEI